MISRSEEEINKARLGIKNYLELQCSKREYCASDIRQKAYSAFARELPGVNCSVMIDGICEDLEKNSFIDDSRFASAFAREKARITGWGPAKIKVALLAKGIARQVVEEALKEIDSAGAEAKMEKIISAKWKFLKDDPYGKFKLLKYALSRGYEYDAVSAAVERIIKNDD